MLIDFDPIIGKIGPVEFSWYGVLFASGFGISRFIVRFIFLKEDRWRPQSDLLLVYMIVGTVIGARLGHILFYEPFYYLSNPLEVFKLWKGGLSSHGTSVGILVAVFFYCYQWNFSKGRFIRNNREGYNYLQLIDRMVIVVAFGGCFIRVGNFINAEAIGKPTVEQLGVFHSYPIKRDMKTHLGSIESIDASLDNEDLLHLIIHFPERLANREVIDKYNASVIIPLLHRQTRGVESTLKRVISSKSKFSDSHFQIAVLAVPIFRHPSQLYEAVGYMILFALLFWYWKRKRIEAVPGRIFGIFLIWLFGSRILWEIWKEESSEIAQGVLNMGQLLSIPFLLLGIILLLRDLPLKQNNKDRG